MTSFSIGDRVRCVDATPLPINPVGAEPGDFDFPEGFIEEGSVYVVCRVGINSQGRPSLRLCGLPVFCKEVEIAWDSLRFRKLGRLRRRAAAAGAASRARLPVAP